MSDLAIMGLTLGGVLGTMMLVVFIITERQSNKRALELKMFQMENTRIVQQLSKTTEQLARSTEEIARKSEQRHAESMQYLEGMWASLGRIIRKQEEGESGSAK